MTPEMLIGLPLAHSATKRALTGALAGDRVVPERRRPRRRLRR